MASVSEAPRDPGARRRGVARRAGGRRLRDAAGEPRSGSRGTAAAEHRRDRDRRPDARVDAGDGQRQLADRRPGGEVQRRTSSTTRSAAPRAPPSSPASTCTTTACSTTSRRTAAFSRFQALHGNNNLAVWLRQCRLLHRPDRQVPERLQNQPARAAGLVGVARGAPYEQRVYNYTLNENGTMVEYGQDPADFKQDVLTRKAVDLVDRRAPQAQPFFLWLTYTAPHVGGPSEPEPAAELPRRREAGAAPRPRVRLRAAAEAPELQRGRRLRQARRDPQPPAPERHSDRGHPAQVPLRAGVAAVGGRGRQEGRRRADGEAASSTTR